MRDMLRGEQRVMTHGILTIRNCAYPPSFEIAQMEISAWLNSVYVQAIVVVAGIASLPIGIYFYRKTLTRHELSYSTWTDTIFPGYFYQRSFGTGSWGAATLRFLEKNGSALCRTLVWIGNTGNQPITYKELMSPLSLSINCDTIYFIGSSNLDSDTICEACETPKERYLSEAIIDIKFNLIRPGCGFMLEVWHDVQHYYHSPSPIKITLSGKTCHILAPKLRLPICIKAVSKFIRPSSSLYFLAVLGSLSLLSLLLSANLMPVTAWLSFTAILLYHFRSRVFGALRRVPIRIAWTSSPSVSAFWDESQPIRICDFEREHTRHVNSWPVLDEWVKVDDRTMFHRTISILKAIEKREGNGTHVTALVTKAKDAAEAAYNAYLQPRRSDLQERSAIGPDQGASPKAPKKPARTRSGNGPAKTNT
jgi:hypothetical protein